MAEEKPKVGARYYDPAAHPADQSLPGVPLRDLSRAEFAALNLSDQRSVDATDWWRSERPADPQDAPAAQSEPAPQSDAPAPVEPPAVGALEPADVPADQE